jgi:hypothetical protein
MEHRFVLLDKEKEENKHLSFRRTFTCASARRILLSEACEGAWPQITEDWEGWCRVAGLFANLMAEGRLGTTEHQCKRSLPKPTGLLCSLVEYRDCNCCVCSV